MNNTTFKMTFERQDILENIDQGNPLGDLLQDCRDANSARFNMYVDGKNMVHSKESPNDSVWNEAYWHFIHEVNRVFCDLLKSREALWLIDHSIQDKKVIVQLKIDGNEVYFDVSHAGLYSHYETLLQLNGMCIPLKIVVEEIIRFVGDFKAVYDELAERTAANDVERYEHSMVHVTPPYFKSPMEGPQSDYFSPHKWESLEEVWKGYTQKNY